MRKLFLGILPEAMEGSQYSLPITLPLLLGQFGRVHHAKTQMVNTWEEAIEIARGHEGTVILIAQASDVNLQFLDGALLCAPNLGILLFAEPTEIAQVESNRLIVLGSSLQQIESQVSSLLGLLVASSGSLARRTNSKKRGSQLTEHEYRVTELLACGNTNQEIAKSLGFSKSRVGSIITSILRKLGCENRTMAAIKFSQDEVQPPAAR